MQDCEDPSVHSVKSAPADSQSFRLLYSRDNSFETHIRPRARLASFHSSDSSSLQELSPRKHFLRCADPVQPSVMLKTLMGARIHISTEWQSEEKLIPITLSEPSLLPRTPSENSSHSELGLPSPLLSSVHDTRTASESIDTQPMKESRMLGGDKFPDLTVHGWESLDEEPNTRRTGKFLGRLFGL
jgi:hypothetical protein